MSFLFTETSDSDLDWPQHNGFMSNLTNDAFTNQFSSYGNLASVIVSCQPLSPLYLRGFQIGFCKFLFEMLQTSSYYLVDL